MKRHLAIDLGASGGRVAIGSFEGESFDFEVIHRFEYTAVPLQGGLFTDILYIWQEILAGLKLASAHGEIASLGVNSWAVDYALVREDGTPADAIHHYRSDRNAPAMERTIARLGRERLFGASGLQFLPFNTIYQLVAHREELPDFGGAERLLMIPDLLHVWLGGRPAQERTNASTTGLYDPQTRDWAWDLIRELDLPERLFGEIVDPGTELGTLSESVQRATGLGPVPIVAPATHDTASAVAAVPVIESEEEADSDWAYISSGTWSLVGIETPQPIITPDALRTGLTNEAGLQETTRLLKNVMGLWILQECRRAWAAADGQEPAYADLYAEAEACHEAPVFDPDDPRFLAPGADMPDRVAELTGLSLTEATSRGEIVRSIFESLAARTAENLDLLERVSGRTIRRIHIVGGGSQVDLLNRLIAQRSRREVIAGPVDATLMGNLLVQAEACGTIAPGSIRRASAHASTLRNYTP